MATFTDFRDGRGGEMLRRCLDIDISALRNWAEYSSFVLRQPDRVGLIRRAFEAAGKLSRTESVVIAAALAAADLHREAASLDAGEFWWRLGNFDEATAMAVAAVVMRRDADVVPLAKAA